jgi:conserved hypothetical protein TIGR00305
MKAVLDTNVLISGIIATGVPHEILLRGFTDEFEMVVSVETLRELRQTLHRYPERFDMTADEIQAEVETIRYFATFVDPATDITAVDDDPDDDKFLEAAVTAEVDYLVSGDSHLRELGSFRGVDIIEPRAFYERLNKSDE